MRVLVMIRGLKMVRLLTAAMMLATGALGQSDDLYGSLIDFAQEYPGDWLRWAPLVVRVRVLENSVISDTVPARFDPEMKLVRRRVVGEVLEVLRRPERHSDVVGEAGPIEFTYYALERERNERPIFMPTFRAEVGHVYLFGLMVEQGRLRSIGDVRPYMVEVAGEPGPPGPEMQRREIRPGFWQLPDVGGRIAAIVLAPCGRCDVQRYVARVSGAQSLAESLAGRMVSYRLLRQRLSESLPIRIEVCVTLNRVYRGQGGCLDDLVRDPGVREDVRGRLKDLVVRNRRLEQLLLDEMRDPAALGWGRILRSGSMRQNREELLILLEHPSARIRRLARIALGRYFPGEAAGPRPR